MQFQLRPDDDDRAARVIDALAKQVLAESTTFALEHVGKRFERTITCTRNSTAMPAVVKERIDRFLKHPLLVPDNHVRRFELEQIL